MKIKDFFLNLRDIVWENIKGMYYISCFFIITFLGDLTITFIIVTAGIRDSIVRLFKGRK